MSLVLTRLQSLQKWLPIVLAESNSPPQENLTIELINKVRPTLRQSLAKKKPETIISDWDKLVDLFPGTTRSGDFVYLKIIYLTIELFDDTTVLNFLKKNIHSVTTFLEAVYMVSDMKDTTDLTEILPIILEKRPDLVNKNDTIEIRNHFTRQRTTPTCIIQSHDILPKGTNLKLKDSDEEVVSESSDTIDIDVKEDDSLLLKEICEDSPTVSPHEENSTSINEQKSICLTKTMKLLPFLTKDAPFSCFSKNFKEGFLHNLIETEKGPAFIKYIVSLPVNEAWDLCDQEVVIPYIGRIWSTFSNPEQPNPLVKEILEGIEKMNLGQDKSSNSEDLHNSIRSMNQKITDISLQLCSAGRIQPPILPLISPFVPPIASQVIGPSSSSTGNKIVIKKDQHEW